MPVAEAVRTHRWVRHYQPTPMPTSALEPLLDDLAVALLSVGPAEVRHLPGRRRIERNACRQAYGRRA